MQRVSGLDSIRFILAFIVLLYHVGHSHIYSFIDRTTTTGKYISAALDCLFNGPAAVVVFFVISGFCIHYPQTENKKLNITDFLKRRYIRIMLPILICYIILNFYESYDKKFTEIIGWSIICELIYYTIYPLLLVLSRYLNLCIVLLFTFILSIILVWKVNPEAFMYPSYGVSGNAILGLPCLTLGIILANLSSSSKFIIIKNIYVMRFAIFFLSILCFSLMLHLKIGFPWTLNFFAIFAFVWLYHEIIHFRVYSPSRILEWAGKWSYSLYLVHGLILVLYKRNNIKPYESITEWTLLIITMLMASYTFYLLVEKPSIFISKNILRSI